MGEVFDKGPWEARRSDVKGVFVESGDFTHDVRLYVNGDFRDDEQRFAYAEGLAEVLTTAQAENEALRAFALKAFTIVEWATGEGFVLETPHYDCDDTYLEGVALLGVETADEARAAISGSKP